MKLLGKETSVSQFIKIKREQHLNWNLLPPLYCNSLMFIIYSKIKQPLNSWLFQIVTGYQIKSKLAA